MVIINIKKHWSKEIDISSHKTKKNNFDMDVLVNYTNFHSSLTIVEIFSIKKDTPLVSHPTIIFK